MRNGMTPLFTYDELEKWFDRFQSKAEDKMLVFLQAGGEKFIEVARRCIHPSSHSISGKSSHAEHRKG